MAKIIKCDDASGEHWFHYSAKKDTFVYRQLTPDGLSAPLQVDAPRRCGPELTLPQASKILRNLSLTIKEPDAPNWAKLLEILENKEFDQIVPCKLGKVVVPRTRLRKFRFAFRDWTKELKRSQARFFASNIDCLEQLWSLSLKQMAKYDFQKPFYESNRKDSSSDPKPLSSIKNTIDAGNYFSHHFATEQDIGGVKFRYLDREIAPLRTPGANFVDGGSATSSGCGGMDLLLLSNDHVCAGEVKVGRDSELFEALLQALWYGSELATKSQIARVAKHYIPNEDLETKVDIAVFSINQQRKDPTREATVQLVNEIQRSTKFPNLGRIYLFENDRDQWRTIS